MSAGIVILIVVAIALLGYFVGRRRSTAVSGGDIRKLHSLPSYYGQTVFLFSAVPALLVLMVWILVQPLYVEATISDMIDPASIGDGSSRSLVMSEANTMPS